MFRTIFTTLTALLKSGLSIVHQIWHCVIYRSVGCLMMIFAFLNYDDVCEGGNCDGDNSNQWVTFKISDQKCGVRQKTLFCYFKTYLNPPHRDTIWILFHFIDSSCVANSFSWVKLIILHCTHEPSRAVSINIIIINCCHLFSMSVLLSVESSWPVDQHMLYYSSEWV